MRTNILKLGHSFPWTGYVSMVPENVHTLDLFPLLPRVSGKLEIPGGWEGSQRPKTLRKCMKHNWNFQRSGGGGGS